MVLENPALKGLKFPREGPEDALAFELEEATEEKEKPKDDMSLPDAKVSCQSGDVHATITERIGWCSSVA